MTTLTDIFQSDAKYVRDSGLMVRVSKSIPSVTISRDDFNIHLDGDEAAAFIERAETLWGELKNLAIDDAYYAAVRPYVLAA